MELYYRHQKSEFIHTRKVVRKISIRTWSIDMLGGGTAVEVDAASFFDYATEYYVRNLAFQSAVNLISNSVSKCEFKTFFLKNEVKKIEHYKWNIEPNKNQNSSMFIHKLIAKLYENNECLVIENNDQFLVADTFFKKEFALFDYQFTGVTVDGFEFKKAFAMSDVMYFQLNNKDVRKLINGMYESYGKLIAYAQKSYTKSKGNRGVLDVSAMAQNKNDFQTTFDTMMNEYFKKFFESDNAVIPLFDGYTYTDIGSKTYSNETARDIKALIDDVYDFTARAFQIPPALLRGDMANIKDCVDNYLTFCIDPLCDMLQEEIIRKRCGYSGFSQGTYVKIETNCIKHVDLFSVATSIDKLISSGCYCPNDIRKAMGEEIIDEPWAWEHFITKNYSSAEDLLKEILEGGDVTKT